MVNFKKNSNRTNSPTKPGKRSKQDRRWTLLFIGNHGRTITLKRFKGIVILSVLVLLVCIGVSVGLFAWNLKIIMNNHGLKDDLKKMSQQVDALRHDKDILMTRLVVAESKVENSSVGKSREPAAEKINRLEQRKDDNKIEETQPTIKKTALPAPKQTDSAQSAVPADSELSVAVEKFQISNQPNENRLKVWFKIKNTSPNSRKVSGHTIVVLKGDQTSWLPIPWIPLVDGKPTGKRRGHSFGINYFKTMRLSTRAPESPEKFQTATVFVFTRRGELLLEKQYPVELPPNKPVQTQPADSMHAIPTETDSPVATPPATPTLTPQPAETPPVTETLTPPSADVPPGVPTD